MQMVRELIARVAPTSAAVLITGETGTGKELVARAIHKSSPRVLKPFVAVNCAAFTETLLESELFGHEKGAFTGADRSRPGLFEAAHGGTLFLDEVAEMSPSAQAQLLRVVTDGQVLRVGSTQPRKVDVRLLTATHRDLQQRVREGPFREDLYYRLAVVPITIPPLRERTEDIPVLCELFLRQVAQELKLPRRTLCRETLERLKRYDFPGNARELRNLIERAVILSRGNALGVDSFPLPTGGGKPPSPGTTSSDGSAGIEELLPEVSNLRGFLMEVEKALILRTLKATAGAQAEAARRLGISRSDLGYKMAKYGIENADG
jgi:DNA-binding NtrC family response regulator